MNALIIETPGDRMKSTAEQVLASQAELQTALWFLRMELHPEYNSGPLNDTQRRWLGSVEKRMQASLAMQHALLAELGRPMYERAAAMMHIVHDNSIGVTYATRGLIAIPGGWWNADAYRVIFDSCIPDTEIDDQQWFEGGAFRYDEVSIIEISS